MKVFNKPKHQREFLCCDECFKKIPAGPKTYLSCKGCNYNLCQQCSFGEIIESVKSVSKPSRSDSIARLSSPVKKKEVANRSSLIPILEDESDQEQTHRYNESQELDRLSDSTRVHGIPWA